MYGGGTDRFGVKNRTRIQNLVFLIYMLPQNASIVVAQPNQNINNTCNYPSAVECRTRNPVCCHFEVQTIVFSPRHPSSLSCINEYLAIDSGGNIWMVFAPKLQNRRIVHSWVTVRINRSARRSVKRFEGPADWIWWNMRTYLLYLRNLFYKSNNGQKKWPRGRWSCVYWWRWLWLCWW